jgi:branched-chain amino acid transport system ATP-binding protein
VGLTIERGQVYGLIGPNGAGKTTFFNVITGLYTPDSGTFELAGKPYQPTAVHEVAIAGIARTFQNIELFEHASVLHNLLIGRHAAAGVRPAGFRVLALDHTGRERTHLERRRGAVGAGRRAATRRHQ